MLLQINDLVINQDHIVSARLRTREAHPVLKRGFVDDAVKLHLSSGETVALFDDEAQAVRDFLAKAGTTDITPKPAPEPAPAVPKAAAKADPAPAKS
jgi:hypothetical protein